MNTKMKNVVWGRIHRFAYDAGYTLVNVGKNGRDLYDIFDIKASRYVYRGLTPSEVLVMIQRVLSLSVV